MITLGDKLVVAFDVDDTLIMWGPVKKNEIGSSNDIISFTDSAGLNFTAKFHKAHVENIKQHFHRGHHVIVWSAGGGKWAEAAVKALGLEKYVHMCMNKPSWYYDDKKVEDWMGNPIYLDTNSRGM